MLASWFAQHAALDTPRFHEQLQLWFYKNTLAEAPPWNNTSLHAHTSSVVLLGCESVPICAPTKASPKTTKARSTQHQQCSTRKLTSAQWRIILSHLAIGNTSSLAGGNKAERKLSKEWLRGWREKQVMRAPRYRTNGTFALKCRQIATGNGQKVLRIPVFVLPGAEQISLSAHLCDVILWGWRPVASAYFLQDSEPSQCWKRIITIFVFEGI